MSLSSRIPVTAKIAGGYLLFSVLWILLSDRVLVWAIPDDDLQARLQTIKGLVFVLASAVLILVLTRRYLGRLERQAEQLAEAYDQTLAGWAAALDIRDHSTGQHTQRVTELTVDVATRMGVSGDDLDDIRRGATLHDIGKMALPDGLLAKEDALTDEEWALIRQHPELAMRMLSGIAYLDRALVIPWCHHEKWDGSGYPRGLAGEQIPFPARLFAVVDVYDALTSERPYRSPITTAEALDHIEAGSGTHFDPDVVAVFTELMRERESRGLIREGGRL